MASVHANLGSAFIGLGKYEPAIKSFERALEIEPKPTSVLFNLGLAYYYQHDYRPAVDHLKRFLQAHSSHSQANYLAGLSSFLLRDFSSAIDYLGRAKRGMPADLPLLYSLASSYIQANQVSEAESSIQEIFSKFADTAEMSLLLAQLHYQYGEHDQALEKLRRTFELNSQMPLAHYLRGMIYWKRSQLDRAKKEFLSGIQVDEKYKESYFMLAHIQAKRRDYKQEIPLPWHVIELLPHNSPGAYYLLGKCHIRLGEIEEGLEYLREAISQDKKPQGESLFSGNDPPTPRSNKKGYATSGPRKQAGP